MGNKSFSIAGAIVIGVAAAIRVSTAPAVQVEAPAVNPVTVLVTMSTFSALSTNLITDQELDSRLRTGGSARVLLFAGRESEQALVDGSYDKLTTMLRRGDSVEVNIPTGNGLYAGAENLPAGWSYAVRLEPNVTACCDGGDNQCERRQAGTADGALNRSLAQLHPPNAQDHQLTLTLTQLAPPVVNGALSNANERQPSALIRASSAVPTLVETSPDGGGGVPLQLSDVPLMMCTLKVAEDVIATGRLRSASGNSETSQQVLGTLDLTYRK